MHIQKENAWITEQEAANLKDLPKTFLEISI